MEKLGYAENKIKIPKTQCGLYIFRDDNCEMACHKPTEVLKEQLDALSGNNEHLAF